MSEVSPAYIYKSLTLEQINSLSKESFYYFFENVVITNPEYFHKIWSLLPFTTKYKLINTFLCEIDKLNEYDKFVMLHRYNYMMKIYINNLKPCHKNNEKIQNDENLTYNTLTDLVMKYKDKFSFPFIFYPVEKNVNIVFKEAELRFNNSELQEIKQALNVIKQIAIDNLETRII